MNIYIEKNNTIVEGITDFDLAQTLECGQCFRFYKQSENDYVIVAYGKLLHIIQQDKKLIFLDTSKEEVESLWMYYFDLQRDYGAIKKFLLKKDKTLKNAIEEKRGVRILNQEFHEVLISFIISQNKQIPQIKQLVRRISENYGEYLGEINGEKYYSFPTPEKLGVITEQNYRDMKTGFRAPYLFDASQRLANGVINQKMFSKLTEEEALQVLLEIKGVGEKVANCVMLFALGYREVFPIDVWIKRIMETLYFEGKDTPKNTIQEFAKDIYGKYGGYAQQYLFCFGRDLKLGVKDKK